jgi:xanthine dehydrogenase accessory factor
MNNIYLLIPDKKPQAFLALATVIATKGSTPQKHGSSALFDLNGLVAGTVGGGVLEGRVQQLSQKVIQTKKSGIYHFSFDKDISFKEEAICGGQATILIDAAPVRNLAVFDQMKYSLKRKIPGILVTTVSGSDESNMKIDRDWIPSDRKNDLKKKYPDYLTIEIEKMLSVSDPYNFKKIILESEGKEAFVLLEPLFPPSHLIIAGAGHIGRSLSHLGKLLDFDVTVIDDRIEYANPDNIPDGDHFIVEDIGKAIEEIDKDADTFIVIVTRGHNDDANALKMCINSGAAYIGMIGSKNKIALVHREFVQNGWATEAQWSAIHSPIGLGILSQTVEEIAVSIAAELVLVRNHKLKGLKKVEGG